MNYLCSFNEIRIRRPILSCSFFYATFSASLPSQMFRRGLLEFSMIGANDCDFIIDVHINYFAIIIFIAVYSSRLCYEFIWFQSATHIQDPIS